VRKKGNSHLNVYYSALYSAGKYATHIFGFSVDLL